MTKWRVAAAQHFPVHHKQTNKEEMRGPLDFNDDSGTIPAYMHEVWKHNPYARIPPVKRTPISAPCAHGYTHLYTIGDTSWCAAPGAPAGLPPSADALRPYTQLFMHGRASKG